MHTESLQDTGRDPFNLRSKQGGAAYFQSFRITLYATTIQNLRACYKAEGRVEEQLKQPNITIRLLGAYSGYVYAQNTIIIRSDSLSDDEKSD